MRNIIILLLCMLTQAIQYWDYNQNHTYQCIKSAPIDETSIWKVMILHHFDRYWFIGAGLFNLILLTVVLLTYRIKNSKSQPSDIIFMLTIFEIMFIISSITQSFYYIVHDPDKTSAPPGYLQFCTGIGFLGVLATSGINMYNIMFCVILSYTVRHTLKGAFFTKTQYHIFTLGGAISITIAIYVTNSVGKSLNGMCAFKYSNQSPYLYFLSAMVLILIGFVSVYNFRRRIPKNEFFQKQSVYKYYYYYIAMVALVELIISIAYMIGNVNCHTKNPDPMITISATIGNAFQMVHPWLIFFIRYKHPLVKKAIRSYIFQKQQEEIDVIKQLYPDQQIQPQYNWLGSLLESIRASQVYSFLTGMLISYVEFEEHSAKSIKQVHYYQNYTFKVHQNTADLYMEKRRSNRQSRRVKRELGGLKPLYYEITSYCPMVFNYFLKQHEKNIQIEKSLNIQNNSSIIKKIADIQGGKSGQFFFFSFDFQVLFKTVSKQEIDTYLKNIKAFAQYYQNNQNSLIVKILGMYKFTRTDIPGQEIYIILQKNLSMCDRIHIERIFDLKGSKYNRQALTQRQNISDLSSLTLKDLDFLNTEKKIFVPQFITNSLKKILEKDFNFLKKLDVMDYSLLIMKVDWEQVAFFSKKDLKYVLPKQKNPFLIVRSEVDKAIYYHFGVIDYLQQWNIRKQTQRLFKQMITRQFNESIVTAEDPETYAERLKKFVETIF